MRIASTHVSVSVSGSESGWPVIMVVFRPDDFAPVARESFPPRTKWVYGEKGIADLSEYPFAAQKLLSLERPDQFWEVGDDAKDAVDSMPDGIRQEYLARQAAEEEAAMRAFSENVGKKPAPRRPR